MKKKGSTASSKKVIVYLHGGLQNVWESEIGIARGYLNRTGFDVYYPIYPSPLEVSIMESIEVCYQCYKKAAEIYGANHVILAGCSFGGFYALQVMNQINLRKEVKMPSLVLAFSPAGIPDQKEELEKMKELSKKDPMISYEAMMMTKEVAAWFDKTVPEYVIYPALEDFSNAPATYLYYGEETVFANAGCYQRAFDRAGCGDKLVITMQKGMMHGYACTPVFPECKRVYEQQIQLMMQ